MRTLPVLLSLILIAPLLAADAPATETKTGEFETSFTERSPLSAAKEINRRLPRKQPIPDYDLSTEKFMVYVPKTYSADAPAGLIVFECYKAAHETPASWHEMLDKHNLIFVVPCNKAEAISTRVGLSLDAVHNLQKQYKIDPARIWMLGEAAGSELAFGYPDVFSAGIYRNHYYFRPMKSKQPNSGMYPPSMPAPESKSLAKTKLNSHIILQWAPGQESEPSLLMPVLMKQDGFKHVMSISVDKEPYHYPNFTTDWMEKVIEFIESTPKEPVVAATPTEPAEAAAKADATSRPIASNPAAAPAPSDPQKLLSLARTYIAAKAYGPARTRLQTIIDKYPTDPAAVEARKLLATLP